MAKMIKREPPILLLPRGRLTRPHWPAPLRHSQISKICHFVEVAMLPKCLVPVALSVANVAAHPVDAPTKTVWASSTTSTLPVEGIEYILPKDDQPTTTVAPTPQTTAAAAVLSASSPKNPQQRSGDGHEYRTRDVKEWFKNATEAVLSASSPENPHQRPEDDHEYRTRDVQEWFKNVTEALGKYDPMDEVRAVENLLERRCREDPVGFMEEIEFKYSKFRQQCRFTSLVPDDQRTKRLNHSHSKIP